MGIERFVAGQRKGVHLIFVGFLVLLSVMWIATVCDWTFDMGWGSDRQIVWLAPPMMLFAVFVRFCCMVIFRFIGGNMNGG